MNPFRTPAVLDPEPRTRFDAMLWLLAAGRILKRYAAGIVPAAAVLLAYRTGLYAWCVLLGNEDLDLTAAKRGQNAPEPWYFFMWAFGLAVITSPVWAPRLGGKVIGLLWPAKEST